MCDHPDNVKDLEHIFKVFKDSPDDAFRLATILHSARQVLNLQPSGKEAAANILNDAIDALFPYTYYGHASRRLYRKAVEGTLAPEHNPLDVCLAADPTWSEFYVTPDPHDDDLY